MFHVILNLLNVQKFIMFLLMHKKYSFKTTSNLLSNFLHKNEINLLKKLSVWRLKEVTLIL